MSKHPIALLLSFTFGLILPTVAHADADGDGFSEADGDCNDGNVNTYPGAIEICDGTDNNCNGFVDDNAFNATTWWLDSDFDGSGNGDAVSVWACEQPPGYAPNSSDCDDTDPLVSPMLSVDCNTPLVDTNCDGFADGDQEACQMDDIDADGDGYSVAEGDCDDGNVNTYPDAMEICDGADNDCNGTVDDGAGGEIFWYPDSDLDGFGDMAGESVWSCIQPPGYSAVPSDCDDTDPWVNSMVPVDCDTPLIDTNCDGILDGNQEACQIGMCSADADCEAPQICSSGICVTDIDVDGDGVGADDDCDDSDPTVSADCSGQAEDCEAENAQIAFLLNQVGDLQSEVADLQQTNLDLESSIVTLGSNLTLMEQQYQDEMNECNDDLIACSFTVDECNITNTALNDLIDTLIDPSECEDACPFPAGDLNQDGDVNIYDVVILVEAIMAG